MDARSAARLASGLRPGLVAVVHVNADPDAVGSAFALARAYGGSVAAPAGLAAAGRRLATALGLVVADELPDGAQRVLVDAASAAQFRPWEARLAPYLLVDHHAEADLAAGAEAAFVAPRSSCAEAVLEVLDTAGRPPDALASFALLAAIVADTGRFRFADGRTFAASERLLAACGRPWAAVLEAIEEDEEEDTRSGRLAALKAAQRADVRDAGPWVLATSSVSSHEARAAVGLVRCGADVALVAAPREDGLRVSGRASSAAAARLHLGRIFHDVARGLGASGGGHAASAGLNGRVPEHDAMARLVRAVEEASR